MKDFLYPARPVGPVYPVECADLDTVTPAAAQTFAKTAREATDKRMVAVGRILPHRRVSAPRGGR